MRGEGGTMKRKENLKSMEAVIGDAIADSGVRAVLLLVLVQAGAGAGGPTAKRWSDPLYVSSQLHLSIVLQ